MQRKVWKDSVVQELQITGPDEGKLSRSTCTERRSSPSFGDLCSPPRGRTWGGAVPEFLLGGSGDGVLWLQKRLTSLREASVGPLYSFAIYELYPLVAIRLSIDHCSLQFWFFQGFLWIENKKFNQISVCIVCFMKIWVQLLLIGLVLFGYQSEQCSAQQ